MNEPTTYTVTVWFRDLAGRLHEKAFLFNTSEVAKDFERNIKAYMKDLKKSKVALTYGVETSPCLS